MPAGGFAGIHPRAGSAERVSGMQIGTVTITGHAALAPMAGVADRAFRRLCRGYGAAFTVSEMVSSKGLSFGDRKSGELLQLDSLERPSAVQLFGNDPATMAQAAELAMRAEPDWLDINMGCPAPKIAGNGCGSALMRDPALCGRLVAAVCAAVDRPVTAKIRLGYSRDCRNAVEVAKACEAGGAAAITVHGRTRDQMYAPPVDLQAIRAVKQAVGVPVIANGDVTDGPSAAHMLEETGCDMLMVGRGALGAPWVFADIEAYLNEERRVPPPPVAVRMAVLYRQIQSAVEFKGERIALREARKHAAWYLKGWRGAAAFRAEAGHIETLTQLADLCERVIRAAENG